MWRVEYNLCCTEFNRTMKTLLCSSKSKSISLISILLPAAAAGSSY